FYLIPSLHLWRGVAALAVLGTGCAVLISRLVFASAVDQEIFKRRVLVYGAGAAAASVANLRRSADRRGFLLTGFVCPPDEDPEVPAERLLDASGGLRELCERLNVSEVVVAMDDRRRGFPLRELLQCLLAGVDVRVLKFRSMRLDAELEGAQWAQRQDPRVTRVGAIIRKLRVDELPQVINVLRGHMSFVGPRPERPEFVAHLAEEIPYYVQRHCVKPGITGWAQLCYPYGSSEQDALEKLQYDLYYIKNNSLLFDLAILVQTAEVVLLGKGAR